VALLLTELRDVPPERRTARFRTVCVARHPDGREVTGDGVLEGVITIAPRGRLGFGYDPVFEVVEPGGAGRTLAELPADEKNARSHRARAVRAIAAPLAALLAAR
jgi:XTP/dITP diphosphohydrolase